jgi:hypothetical protein
MALMKDGLWVIVNGTEARPADGGDAQGQFDKKRDKALAIIVLSIDPTQLYLIGEPADPIVVWQKLADLFQKKSWANKLHLKKRLYSLRLDEGGSMQEHIKDMTETFNALSVIGDVITDEDRVVHLLASLPDSYSVLVTALEASAEVPSMETVIERLLHEERKTTDSESSHSGNGQKAMTAKRQYKKGPKCYGCGQIGHIKRDCPNQKDRKKSEKKHDKVKASDRAHNTQAKKSGCSDDTDSDSVGLTVRHVLSACDVQTHHWVIDSGATCHMCNDRTLFTDLVFLCQPQKVTLGDGHHLKATGRGTVVLDIELPGGKTKKCKLADALYVPDLTYSLISIAKASDAISSTVFSKEGCEFLDADGKVVATGRRVGELYWLNCRDKQQSARVTQESDSSREQLWHRRYGHLGTQNMKRLVQEDMVTGLNCKMTKKVGVCEPCAEGKQHRTKFPDGDAKRSDTVLGLVHSDVCGKMSTQSLGGCQYFLTLIDDMTRYTWVYVLKHKHEVFNKFVEWKAMAENSTGQKLKVLRTDNGGEYTSREFSRFLTAEGVKHELTVPKTPQQNGVAERMNRTIVETARCMLAEAKLPRKFWAEAVSTAVYLRNRSPTTAVEGMTPYESLTGVKPKVDTLRVFGCLALAHIPRDERQKFDSKSKRCIFLGYGTTVKGYRLYDMERKKVLYSRDVIFDESKPGIQKEQRELVPTVEPPKKYVADMDADDEDEVLDEPEVPAEPGPGRPIRQRQPPDMYGEWVNLSEDPTEPTSLQEARRSPDKGKWQIAMEKEMKSLKDNDVWDLVEKPEGRKVVGSKWVFKKKLNADGSIARYKARLVAQGYSQQRGLDYDETFSPVVRAESVRIMIAVAGAKNMLLHQMDVATAFLNGKLVEEVYMKQPEDFEMEGKEHFVCQLKKSIYGLKQSSRCWNTALHDHLIKIDFKQSVHDPCIYTLDGGSVILAVHVDDIILAAEDERRMKEVKLAIAEGFAVTDLGELNHFVGVTVDQKTKPDAIWIGQPAYTKRVLEKFNMGEAKPVATPVDTSVKLTEADDNSVKVDQELYQSAVGSLLYLSTWTRPDITYAVSNVAKFCSKPSKEHWTAVKRIMRYLRGTVDVGLCYNKGTTNECIGYSDSDWAGDINDRRSTSGYMFQISGAAVSWRSKKQSCVALSTAEAEYMALASAAQEAVWIQQLVGEIQDKPAKSITIYEDNQSSIQMAKNPQFHGRAKHIGIKYHFIREQTEKGTVTLEHCPTDNMVADMLTKGLSRVKFTKLIIMGGVQLR